MRPLDESKRIRHSCSSTATATATITANFVAPRTIISGPPATKQGRVARARARAAKRSSCTATMTRTTATGTRGRRTTRASRCWSVRGSTASACWMSGATVGPSPLKWRGQCSPGTSWGSTSTPRSSKRRASTSVLWLSSCMLSSKAPLPPRIKIQLATSASTRQRTAQHRARSQQARLLHPRVLLQGWTRVQRQVIKARARQVAR